MILAILLTVFVAAFAAMFSAETLVSTILGGLVTIGATQYLKNMVGGNGALATLLASGIALLVAIAALAVSAVFSENGFSYENLPAMGAQVFALATLAYNLFTKSGTATE